MDTRPIWPGRIELIYDRYVIQKNAYLVEHPHVRPSNYRKAIGLQLWTPAQKRYQRQKLRHTQRLNIETRRFLAGPPNWTDEEVEVFCDHEKQQDEQAERDEDERFASNGGVNRDRGIGHMHQRLQSEDRRNRQEYAFFDDV